MENKNALAVMVKTPEPGNVKTRLLPALSGEEAAGLYECFLKDIFDCVRKVGGADIYAAYSHDGNRHINEFIPENIMTFPQEGGTLGERIYNVFKFLFKGGYKKVTVIGSDSPDLPPEYIEEAFGLLFGNTRLVLGPAKDGGYYLIAMNELNAAPFVDIPWSTGTVLEETVKRARGVLEFKLLKPWHDIDTFDDLKLLTGGAPESSRFLRRMGKKVFSETS